MRHDPGLAASPSVRCKLKSGEEWVTPFPRRPLWTNSLLEKRRRAVYGGTGGINGSIRAQAASLSPAERVTHPDSRGHQLNLGDTP
jgi:hypothetical protein